MYKNEQSKEHILEQGFETLIRDGIKFFTVEALAAHLGMSKKTIYKFFPSKEILIEKIVGYFTGMVERKLSEIVKSDIDPIEKFTNFMDFIIDKLSQVSMDRMIEVKNRYPIVWGKIEAFRISLIKDFA